MAIILIIFSRNAYCLNTQIQEVPNVGMQQFIGEICFINFRYLFTGIVNDSIQLNWRTKKIDFEAVCENRSYWENTEKLYTLILCESTK